MNESKDKTIKAAKAVDKALEEPVPVEKELTFSSGVTLRTKKASIGIFIKIYANYPRPPVPKYKDTQSGQWISNPDSQDHIEAIQSWEMELADAMLNAMILLCTEVAKKPKDLGGPDSKGWLEEYEALNLPMKPENKSWRYLNWVLFKVLITEDDLTLLQNEVGALVGVREADVEQATTFPGSDETQ